MISLKKFLDQRAGCKTNEVSIDPFSKVVDAYRSALVAVAKAATLNGSPHGLELSSRLIGLDERIGAKPSVATVQEAGIEFEANLDVWSIRAHAESTAKDNEIKELILALAKTAEAISTRDQENASQFTAFTARLETIGDLDDIRHIRHSIVQRVAEFRTSLEQMTRETRELVAELQTKVAAVETRLKSAECLALTDALTGLGNRRCLEDRIAYNIGHRLTFSVVLFDLNRFKLINDRFGHSAGDDLLKQFASRLKQNSRASDLIGRWGGDEFLIILSGGVHKVRPQVQRLQHEVCARYMLHGSDGFYGTMDIEAAAGIAEWQPEESIQQLLTRADADMYREKRRMKEIEMNEVSPVNT